MKTFKEIFDIAMSLEYSMSDESLTKAISDNLAFEDSEKVLCDIIRANNHGWAASSYGVSYRTKIGKRRVKKILSSLRGQRIIDCIAVVDDEGYLRGRGYCYLGSKL